MPLPSAGFPSCNKLIEKKWEERKMRLHAQRVHAVETTLKTGPPKVYPHMILRLKQIQKEEQKLADIDRSNQILLERMTWILKRKGQVDNWNDYRQMSMNQSVREKELQTIAEKNILIARKLESVKPYYSAYEQEEEYDKKQYIQSMWNRSTRDFELQSSTTPRSMASKRANSVETLPHLDKKDGSKDSQKSKSDSNSSSVTKLPKINSNANTKYPRELSRRKKKKHRRRLSSRLSESEGEASTHSSSSSHDLSNADSVESIKKKNNIRQNKKNSKKTEQDNKGQKSRTNNTDTNRSKKAKHNKRKSPPAKRSRDKSSSESSEESSDEDSTDKDRVYDVERVQSVVRDRRTKQGQRSVSRAFSGKLETRGDSSYSDDYEDDDEDDNKGRRKSNDSTGNGSVFESSDDSEEADDLHNQKDSPADQDAKLLFRAVKNLVKPEDAVIKALIRRTASQRMQTKDRFEEAYDTNLASELKKALGTPHNLLVDCLLGTGSRNITSEINTAIKAPDVVKLVTLFNNKSSSQLAAADVGYKKDFDVSLEEDIRAKIQDEDCQALLLALSVERPEDPNVDEDLATKDAEELIEAGEGRFSNENGKFVRLVRERSRAQLHATFKAYKSLSEGKSIKELLEEDRCSKDYIAAVEELEKLGGQDKSYWADKIHSQLKPNNPDLINLLLDQSEQDMKGLGKAYRKKYKSDLQEDISSKCGREAGPLIALIGTKGQAGQKQPLKQGEDKRVNGIMVPGRQKNPPLRGYAPRTPDFGKENPFQEPMRRPLGDHIRQEAKQKLVAKKQPTPPKGSKQDKDTKKKGPSRKSNNPDEDAKRIHEALKGGSDEEPVINILTARSNEQRQQIRKSYQENYKKDLLEDLKSELSGEYEEAVIALVMGSAEYDAYCLHDAVDGLGTNEAVLIGILTTRSPKEMKALSSQYKKAYGESLESAIEGDTSGGFQDLLAELLKGTREQKSSVDQKLVEQDAKALYQDGADLNIKDETFKTVMVKRSRPHIRAVFDKYKKLSGHTMEAAIKDALSGDAEDGYLGLAQAVRDTPEFYARRLHDAMSGPGTNDTTIIRIMVSRSEIDLADIKEKYKSLYDTTLEEEVKSECSGDYKKLLLSILKENILRHHRDRRIKFKEPVRESKETSTGNKVPPSQHSEGRSEKYPRPPKGEKPAHPRRTAAVSTLKPKNLDNSPYNSPRSPKAIRAKKPEGRKQKEDKEKSDDAKDSNKKTKSKEDENVKMEDGKKEKSANTQEEAKDEGAKEGIEDQKQPEKERPLVERKPASTQGTISSKAESNADDDVKDLEDALKGWNNDESALINLLCQRTHKQRQLIRKKYQDKHKKNLLDMLQSELSGDFERAMVMMMNAHDELVAEQLHNYMDSMSEDNALLVNMLAFSSQKEMKEITSTYKRLYKKSFIKDVKDNDTDYAFVDIMTEILSGSRDMSYMVDEEGARENANTMYNNGKHRVKPVDEAFRSLLTTANQSQFRATCDDFKTFSGEDLEEAIRWAMIGDSEDALIGLVQCLLDPVKYFAEHLHEAMEGLGTNDIKLISIIITRSEIDLEDIKNKFKELYEKELRDAITRECSGDYKKMLIAILDGGATVNTSKPGDDHAKGEEARQTKDEKPIKEIAFQATSTSNKKSSMKNIEQFEKGLSQSGKPQVATKEKKIDRKQAKVNVSRTNLSKVSKEKSQQRTKEPLKESKEGTSAKVNRSLQEKREETYKHSTFKPHTMMTKTQYPESKDEDSDYLTVKKDQNNPQLETVSKAGKTTYIDDQSKTKGKRKAKVTQKHEQAKLIWTKSETKEGNIKIQEKGQKQKTGEIMSENRNNEIINEVKSDTGEKKIKNIKQGTDNATNINADQMVKSGNLLQLNGIGDGLMTAILDDTVSEETGNEKEQDENTCDVSNRKKELEDVHANDSNLGSDLMTLIVSNDQCSELEVNATEADKEGQSSEGKVKDINDKDILKEGHDQNVSGDLMTLILSDKNGHQTENALGNQSNEGLGNLDNKTEDQKHTTERNKGSQPSDLGGDLLSLITSEETTSANINESEKGRTEAMDEKVARQPDKSSQPSDLRGDLLSLITSEETTPANMTESEKGRTEAMDENIARQPNESSQPSNLGGDVLSLIMAEEIIPTSINDSEKERIEAMDEKIARQTNEDAQPSNLGGDLLSLIMSKETIPATINESEKERTETVDKNIARQTDQSSETLNLGGDLLSLIMSEETPPANMNESKKGVTETMDEKKANNENKMKDSNLGNKLMAMIMSEENPSHDENEREMSKEEPVKKNQSPNSTGKLIRKGTSGLVKGEQDKQGDELTVIEDKFKENEEEIKTEDSNQIPNLGNDLMDLIMSEENPNHYENIIEQNEDTKNGEPSSYNHKRESVGTKEMMQEDQDILGEVVGKALMSNPDEEKREATHGEKESMKTAESKEIPENNDDAQPLDLGNNLMNLIMSTDPSENQDQQTCQVNGGLYDKEQNRPKESRKEAGKSTLGDALMGLIMDDSTSDHGNEQGRVSDENIESKNKDALSNKNNERSCDSETNRINTEQNRDMIVSISNGLEQEAGHKAGAKETDTTNPKGMVDLGTDMMNLVLYDSIKVIDTNHADDAVAVDSTPIGNSTLKEKNPDAADKTEQKKNEEIEGTSNCYQSETSETLKLESDSSDNNSNNKSKRIIKRFDTTLADSPDYEENGVDLLSNGDMGDKLMKEGMINTAEHITQDQDPISNNKSKRIIKRFDTTLADSPDYEENGLDLSSNGDMGDKVKKEGMINTAEHITQDQDTISNNKSKRIIKRFDTTLADSPDYEEDGVDLLSNGDMDDKVRKEGMINTAEHITQDPVPSKQSSYKANATSSNTKDGAITNSTQDAEYKMDTSTEVSSSIPTENTANSGGDVIKRLDNELQESALEENTGNDLEPGGDLMRYILENKELEEGKIPRKMKNENMALHDGDNKESSDREVKEKEFNSALDEPQRKGLDLDLTTTILGQDTLDGFMKMNNMVSNDNKKASVSHGSDGKDEGIELGDDIESKESGIQESKCRSDISAKESNEGIGNDTESVQKLGANNLYKSQGYESISQTSPGGLDFPRPRDPMCTDKQAQVERTPVRKDTVDENIGQAAMAGMERSPDEAAKRKLVLRRRSSLKRRLSKRSSFLSGKATGGANRIDTSPKKDGGYKYSAMSDLDGNESDYDTASRDVQIGSCAEWSTDDELLDDEMFDDDWDDELAAVEEAAEGGIHTQGYLPHSGQLDGQEKNTTDLSNGHVQTGNTQEESVNRDTVPMATDTNQDSQDTPKYEGERTYVQQIVSNIIKKSMVELESKQMEINVKH